MARAATKRIMSIGLSVGARLPAFCTSMGRVLLAALPEEEARARIQASPRRTLTGKTVTDIDQIMELLAAARTEGHAIVDQELEIGLTSIAVPVIDARGRTLAAINIGTQATRFPPDLLARDLLPKLKAAQAELSRIVG